MGKGSGGAWWAFLLLAGVLLAVAATAGAEEDGGVVDNRDRKGDMRWCKKACEWQYGQDTRQKRECESRCRHRQHHEAAADADGEEVDGNGGMDIYGSGRSECVRRCMRHHEHMPWRMQECRRQCYHRGRQGDEEVEEEEEYNSGEGGRQCRERCERRHRGDWWEKQRCLMDCKSGQEQEDSGGRCQKRCQHYGDRQARRWRMERSEHRQGQEEEDDDEDTDRGGRCQRRCQHYHDWDKKQQRMSHCHGGRDDAVDADEDNSGRGDRCQKQCQHYHDWDKKQQCVRDCRGGHHGWETVAGAILAVV